MYLKQFFDNITHQSSFFLACEITRKAVVIDPDRTVDKYLLLAATENYEISHIVNTIGGMEQISGSRLLAEKVNATVFFSNEHNEDWKYNFKHKKIKSGDIFQMGSYRFEALEAKLHFGNKISYLITKEFKDTPYVLIAEDFVVRWNFVSTHCLKKIRFNTATKSREKLNLFIAKNYSQIKENQKNKVRLAPYQAFRNFSTDNIRFNTSNYTNDFKRQIFSSIKNYSDCLLNTSAIKFDILESNQNYSIIDRKKNMLSQSKIRLKKLSSEEWIDELTKNTRVLHIMDSKNNKSSHLPNSIEIKTEECLRIWLKKLEDYGEDYIIFSETEDVHSVENVMVTMGCEHALGHFCPTNFYWSEQKSELTMA